MKKLRTKKTDNNQSQVSANEAELTDRQLEQAAKLVVRDYGETLKLLANE